MILQALTRYYEDLLAQGKIDAPGWAPAKISFALYLDENGGLTQVVPTMEDVTKGKKTTAAVYGAACGCEAHGGYRREFLVGQLLLSARYRPKR